MCRYFLRSQVKAFTGNRNCHRAKQDNGIAVELTVNRFFINTADTAAVTVINTVIDAQRLSNDKIAADDVDVRTLEWRIIQTHRKSRCDIELQQTCGLLNQLERAGIGDADVFMINRFVIMLRKVLINLRSGAINNHQTDA
ncbi:hypothetical protein SRABI106_03937 [Rahnella aquatilis]|nr:hypothetical protein SRABI106_03937 [Rahnella aquatilis]